jgi:sarcosine oxidase delta subunit
VTPQRPCVEYGHCRQMAAYVYRRHPRGRSRERWQFLCPACVRYFTSQWAALTNGAAGPWVEPLT